MSDYPMDLLMEKIQQIREPRYMSSKQEIIGYFRQHYGEKKWASEAAKYMAGTDDTKSRAYKSARRNFEGKRLHQDTKSAKWKELGKSLPRIDYKPKRNFEIIVKGTQQKGGKRPGTRNRVITVKFAGGDAYNMVNNPRYETIWDLYDFPFDLAEDGEYDLSVYAVSIV